MAQQQFQRFQKIIRQIAAAHTAVIVGLGIATVAPVNAVSAQETAVERGTFLYGTSPEPKQIGHDYMVLRVVAENQVEGVLYQMNSEFACFTGNVAQGGLDLAVVDPFEPGTTYSYQLPYPSVLVADSGDRPTTTFVPEGYHAVGSLSELDQDLLAQCATLPSGR
ncbi:MAG: hypothetical protein WBB82_03030 [Limnothrix sp.]